MDYYNSHYQVEETEEEVEDDTVSLNDLPLTTHDHPSPPEKVVDVFEFSSDPNSTMSHAEDIINCGKLIPFKEQHQSPSFHQPRCPTTPSIYINHHHVSQSLYTRRRRSESLTELKISECRFNSTNMRAIKMRNNRSLDYQKLSRNSSMSSDSPDIYRNNSRGSSRFDGSSIKNTKPRWYVFMFGSVKFPPEMDLQDIKNRQVHRTTSKSLFPNFEVVKKAPANRKRCWGVLKVLSCRDDASVNVTASLACMPRV